MTINRITRSLSLIFCIVSIFATQIWGMHEVGDGLDKLAELTTGFSAENWLGIKMFITTIPGIDSVIQSENDDWQKRAYKPDEELVKHLKRINHLAKLKKELQNQDQAESDKRNQRLADEANARELAKISQEGAEKVKAYAASAKEAVEKLMSARSVGIISATAFSIIGIKFGFNYLQDALDKPTLAIKSSIPSLSDQLGQMIFGKKKDQKIRLQDEVLFEPELEERIKTLTQSYLNAIDNGAPFRNVLFYGEPGTGKTAIATKMALYIDQEGHDMYYLYFAASNLDQFSLEEAIKAINGLFLYAKNSRKKLMIIIDECEVLFANRSGNLSEQARKMLTAFLTFTGQPSRDFVLIGLTNRREAFDTASLSRFYEQIYVGPPNECQRKRIFEKYSNGYLKEGKNLVPQKPTFLQRITGKKMPKVRKLVIDSQALSPTMVEWLLAQIDGFTGRDIENLVIALQAEAYTTKNCTLTHEIVRRVVLRKVDQQRDQKLAESKEQEAASLNLR